MIEIIAIAVYGIICFYGGWAFRERTAARRLNRIMDSLTSHMQEQEDMFIRITIEKDNDVFYVYNMDDKSFMAQGKSRKEIEDVLSSKYPDKSFAAAHANLVEMGFVNESV